MKPIVHERGTPVVGAALIASLGIYCPIPLLRGAIFGLFPGIAHRSYDTATRGAQLGFLCEIGYYVIWGMFCLDFLNMQWDPQYGYNRYLASWLPCALTFIFCGGRSPWPNWLHFHLSVLVWLSVMVLNWCLIWRPRLPVRRVIRILLLTNVWGAIACTVLWVVSPMDHWRYWVPAVTFPKLHGPAWVIVFLSVFPLYGVLIASQFKGAAPEQPA
jgi:hypothetical protein